MTDIDYVDHLARDSARFAAALRDSPRDVAVPTCPDWIADDLLWHLAEVQWYWGTIVREKITETERVNEIDHPSRPTDRAALLAFYDEVSRDLAAALAATTPDTPAWTWSDEQTVGFILRRQAHEALIHRVDAELVAGERTPLDQALSRDGVDEVLHVMYGGAPPWGEFTPAPDPGGPAAAGLAGSAADLNLWLWHRPTVGEVERSGDETVLAALDAAIAPGIN